MPTVHYIVRQNRDRTAADAAVAVLLRIFEVVPAEKSDFERALALRFNDFEARGYRSIRKLITVAYLIMGKLDFGISPG